MARAFLLVMDSLGIGGAPDAQKYGDEGANTLGSIAGRYAEEDIPFSIPFLEQLGLGLAAQQASGKLPAGLSPQPTLVGQWGSASELSSGKDTISGHWEMAGLPVTFDWGYFLDKQNSFPQELIDAMVSGGELPGILGNCQASGTQIITDLGEEHIKTGKPIVYTSADSVIQIAAHEEHFGLERLLKLCELTRKLVDEYNIGRVIARPFDGDSPQTYARTKNRHDYAVPPTGPTLLDKVQNAGAETWAVGKVSDIFAGQGVSHKLKASGHEELMKRTLEAGAQAGEGDLIFTNFVDFDMLYGHRRDPLGYGLALMEFDRMLQDFVKTLKEGDLVVLCADHGNDPTWIGYDHTREQIPVLAFGRNIMPGSHSQHEGFGVVADKISEHLHLD